MKTTFVLSAARLDQLPDLELPEIAFLGRSNVGKSSLLNALINARIARTSSTPGRTQQVNLFRVHAGFGDFALADLPGYGYARVPKAIRASFGPLVDGYVERRLPLRAVLLLVDARRGDLPEDRALHVRLREVLAPRGAAAHIVVTKVDKLPKAKRKPCLAQIASFFGIPREDVLGTSASERIGLDELLARVSAWTTLDGGDPAEST